MKRLSLLAMAIGLFTLPATLRGAEIQTLDLKPGLGEWPFPNLGVAWLLPQGRQVIDGVPFQIDGLVLLYSTNNAQRGRPGRQKVEHIVAGQRFERLHLLAASDSDARKPILAGIIRLQYGDGTDAKLEIRAGQGVLNWTALRHSKSDVDPEEGAPKPVWTGQHSSAAQNDKYFRLFHLVLTNAFPEKQVTEISLESPKTQAGLLIAGVSVGPAQAGRLPDTVPAAKNPLPDLEPRTGEKVASTGTIKTLDGHPLAGARIRVMAVREPGATDGKSVTEHPDIGRGARTDAEGRFTLSLPDDRLYRLLAIADGFETAWYRGLDPKSDPIEIRLKPLSGQDGKYMVHARVLGPDGKPIPWAMVEVDGVGSGVGTSWGGTQNFPEQVVSDGNGEFRLSRKEPFTRVQVRIRAQDFAPQMLWLEVTNIITPINLGPGVLVRGRVVKEGKPLGGVRLGVAGQERWSEVFAGHFEAKTGENGVFSFQHLPTNIAWYIYGTMDSLKSYGAIPASPLQTGAHGTTNDLGDLEVVAGLRLSGQAKTKYGDPLPKNLKLRASYNHAWDSQLASVDPEGKFNIEGLYKGEMEISLDNRQWKLSGANHNLDLNNPWYIIGQFTDNKDDLLLVIEKGQAQYNGSSMGNGNLPTQDWPQNRPLTGAEPSATPPILVSGTVVDDKTGNPLKKFKIIPGYKPPATPGGGVVPKKPLLKQLLDPFTKKPVPWNEMPFWQFARAETVSNGTFQLEFLRLSSTPILRAEADGYEPAVSETIITNTSNLVLRLKQGLGPSGVVLLPNGQPAAGATVLYLALHEQCSLSGRKLSNYGDKEGLKTTAGDGTFAFPVRANGAKLFVSHDAGWAEESVDHAGTGLKLQLKPWASITGTLMNSNGTPAAGVELALTMPNDWQAGDPIINIQGKQTTDGQGNFLFPDVAPRRLDIGRIIPMGSGGGWTYHQQTWFVAQPGTNLLGKVTYDTPPPPPLGEQLKQKLGL